MSSRKAHAFLVPDEVSSPPLLQRLPRSRLVLCRSLATPRQLTHGEQCSRIIHKDERRQGFCKSVLTPISKTFSVRDKVQRTDHMVTRTIWCFVCKENYHFIRSCRQTARLAVCSASSCHTVARKLRTKSSTKNILQCSQMYVNVMARPSVLHQ